MTPDKLVCLPPRFVAALGMLIDVAIVKLLKCTFVPRKFSLTAGIVALRDLEGDFTCHFSGIG
ncbi:MAG: hypothetical protein BGP08_04530 [Rhizobiales bacterium 64-17]|nr:MAG: hypothetical protein BGP08_04530 [Rhizobiales bacterium 64-17]